MSYDISKTCQIHNLNAIYEKYFGIKKDGFFVEIGAFDGESFSNTSGLADYGWQGIYVEPVRSQFERCEQRHIKNNVKVLNYCIGTKEGEVTIYDGGSLSTTDENQVDRYSNIDWSSHQKFNPQVCQQITLERLLRENEVEKNFDLLIIDVEGQEPDVVNSFDITYWMPKMAIIELEDEHESFIEYKEFCDSIKEVRTKFIDLGYVEVYRDKINTVYIYDNFQ